MIRDKLTPARAARGLWWWAHSETPGTFFGGCLISFLVGIAFLLAMKWLLT